MKERLAIIVLAAGLGKRMGSSLPKVAIQTRQKPLIHHVLDAVSGLEAERIIIVTGFGREMVQDIVLKHEKLDRELLRFVVQEKQLGTGDAVKAALPELEDFTGQVLILCGDTPLVKQKTLVDFIASHEASNATVSLISFVVEASNAYGRIIRDPKSSQVLKIREAKDASPSELSVKEVNSAIYVVDSSFLKPAVRELKNENNQKEYYLTDILERASNEGQIINAMPIKDPSEVLGANTLYELSLINRALNMNKIKELADKGVIFELPDSCLVDVGVEAAPGVKIGPNCQLLGNTKIGAGSIIEGSAYVKDCTIGENVTVKFSVRMEGAVIENGAAVGPFAHLRPGSELKQGARIGNFVETKKAVLGRGSKANHLTYLGDCVVGEDTNIGAGTITCNYDGYVKSQTTIGSGVFIGSNSALVAPVTIEDGATVGAGSVITKKVEKDSLALTRAPQLSKAGWSSARRARAKSKKADS